MRHKKKNKKPEITITELLATNCTGPARKLLKQYGKPDAKDYGDLQAKLIELYRDTSDKKQLEKQLAELHPHKDWILQYCAPAPVIAETPKEEIKPVTKDPLDTPGKLTVVDNGYHSMDGNERRSNACGCQHSGFNGPQNNAPAPSKSDSATLVCVVAIVALAAIFIHNGNKLKLA